MNYKLSHVKQITKDILKTKKQQLHFLTEIDTKNYLKFRKEVENISWEMIDNLFNEKIKEVEYNNGKQLTIWQ